MENTKTLFFASAVQPNPGEVQYWIDLKRDPYGNCIKSYDASIGKWVILNYDSTIYRVFDLLGIPYDKDTGEASWPNLGEGSVFGGDTLVEALTNANEWATDVRDNIGKPGGLTPLNDQGYVDSQYLPSYVDDVTEVWVTYDTDPTGGISNIQVWKNKECTTPLTAAQAEKDKIYVDVAPHTPDGETVKQYPIEDEDSVVYPSYQFRWSGSQWVWINGDHLIIGDITGTAFDGGKGYHLEQVANNLPPTVLSEAKDALYAPEYVRVPFEQYLKSEQDVYTKNATDDYTDIKSADNENAGVMPGYLYQFTYDVRNTLPDHLVTGVYLAEPYDDKVIIKTQSANKEYLSQPEDEQIPHVPYDKVPRNDRFQEENKEDDHKHLPDLVIEAASETRAGVLTKDQFIKFNTTIPSQLQSEIERSTTKDTEHDKKLEDLQTEIDAVEEELTAEWNKHIEDFNKARQSVGLTDTNDLPNLDNTHYLNNDAVEDDDNVSSVVGCLTKLDDELHKLQHQVNLIPDYTKVDGEPGGLATLGDDGKVPKEQLPGFVDDVIDVYAQFDTTPTGQLINIKLYTNKEQTTEVQGEVGKIYVNIKENTVNYQFRWSGSQFVHIDSNALILGEITGTAYDGGKGKKLATKSESLPDKILSTFEFGQTYPDKATITLTGKTFDTESGTYKESELSTIDVAVATDTTAGLMSKTDKSALDKAVTDIAKEVEERRAQDDKHSEQIGALRAKAKEVDEHLQSQIDELEQGITDWGDQLDALEQKVDGAISEGTQKFTELEQKISTETNTRTTEVNELKAKDTQLEAKDTELDNKIDQAKADLERELTEYNATLEADIAEREKADEELKQKDIEHQASIDDLKAEDKKLTEAIKSIAEKVGLEDKVPTEEGDLLYELPSVEGKVIIKEATSVFDAIEKLDEGAVPWTVESDKKHIDLPEGGSLRGTDSSKKVNLATVGTANVGYTTEATNGTMKQSELGNTDIHSELKSNDRPTVEVIEKVQKYTDNTKKAIANAVATGVMLAAEALPIAETLNTTEEHHHKHIAYSQDELWYGVRFDLGKTNGVPDGIRTGNLDMHRDLPIQSKMRGCVIFDVDNEIKYLKPDDWTKYEDDTAVADDVSQNKRVNFFVEIPEHYRLFVQTPDNNIEIRISEYNLPGYTHIERKYVGAYEATTDPSYSAGSSDTGATNLEYKVLWSRPDWQKPVVSMKRNDMQKAARKSPDIVSENNRTNNWNMYTYGAHVDITWLFVVEYATLYNQKAFTNALTSDGYHQGGLGPGVTTGLPQTNTFSWVPAGVTHKLGSHTGVAEYTEGTTQANNVQTPDTSQNNGNTSASNKKTEVPRYRGIENPFGHLWKNTIDVVVTGDGAKPHNVYVCKDYTKFSDSIAQSINNGSFSQEGYELQPFTEVNKAGYLNKLVGTNYGDLFAKECTGSATTYYTDYHWTYTSNGSNVAHTLLIGGCSDSGVPAGLFYLTSSHGVDHSSVSVGTRLTFYGDPTDKAAEAAIATAYASQPVPEYGDGPMIFD